MRETSRPLFRMVAAAALGLLVPNGAFAAADGLGGLTPLAPSALGTVNVSSSLINLQKVSNTAAVSGNTISAGGGQIVNGAIQNNAIGNNSGVTAVLMNTGNNVNFQNSMIVNVFTK